MCHDTIVCIVTGTWTGQGESRYKLYCGWVVGRDTALGLVTGRVARQATTQPEGARHDATRLRHGRCWACDMANHNPAIRHPARHDTAQCAHGLGTMRATWAHHARSHGPLGVHLCTQPSFGLSSLFQSLFGPLFMNIIHKIFQKIK